MLLLITTIDFIDGLVSRGHEDSDTPLVRVVSPAIEIATFVSSSQHLNTAQSLNLR